MRGYPRERSNAVLNGRRWELWVGDNTGVGSESSAGSLEGERIASAGGSTACSLLLLVALTALLDAHFTQRFRLDETRMFDATQRDPLATTDISSDD